MRPLFLLLALIMGLTDASAQPTPPALKEISPGVFEYNGVQLDKKNHRISFPAIVNQDGGLIEYLLVSDKGKLHESLFSTKVLPHDIHLALLLIGLKEPKNTGENVPPTAIDTPYLQSAPKLKGPPVQISVAWTQDGKQKSGPAEDWIFNLKTKQKMSTGPWTYNGSMIDNGVFLADQELSIVAVITDPTALVNNPRPGYDDDEIWQIPEKSTPPVDTPVVITITMVEPTDTKP
jgi:hypothetical protein